jgi:hypothetical protein
VADIMAHDEQPQQTRLAGAVEADRAEAFAGADLQALDAQDLASAAAVADVGDVRLAPMRPRAAARR